MEAEACEPLDSGAVVAAGASALHCTHVADGKHARIGSSGDAPGT